MKNLHLLPTDKVPQHIYITSDEEIKEGDWIICSMSIAPTQALKNEDYSLPNGWRKIILTTDQELGNDGVQAIDDKFLEWFVENPSCEEVEVYKVNGKLFAEPIFPQASPETDNTQQSLVEWLFEELEEKGELRETLGIVQLNIFTSEYLDLKRKAKEMEDKILIDLVQSLKDYTRESHNILGFDEREASEFVKIFKENYKK